MLTVDCDPLIEVLSLGQHDGEAQVAGAQRGRCVPHQIVLVCAFGDVFLGFERLVRSTATENFKFMLFLNYSNFSQYTNQ